MDGLMASSQRKLYVASTDETYLVPQIVSAGLQHSVLLMQDFSGAPVAVEGNEADGETELVVWLKIRPSKETCARVRNNDSFA
jgi:hypothetical protein